MPPTGFLQRLRAAPLALAVLIAGCTSSQVAILRSTEFLVMPDSAVDSAPLNPAVRYLRISVKGRPLLMALGFVDRDELTGRPVEVWLSADQHVLRLSDGRLVGLSGTPVEWRSVRLPNNLPAWQSITAPMSFDRQRDEMPGYRIGLSERVDLVPTAPPTGSKLLILKAQDLAWFEERTSTLPPARYAIAASGPVYGEQCLSNDLCITWQTWPPHPSAPKVAP